MKIKKTPDKVIALRLLEEGRATVSDGKDWLRMMFGIMVTAMIVLGICSLYPNSFLEMLLASIVGILLTAEWIMIAGEKAAKRMKEQ